MAYYGVIEDFQRIRENRIPRRVHVVACIEEFDVRWHGMYTYEEFCQDGDKMFEVFKSSVERFDYDWAWLQIDDCFEIEPLGVKVKGEGNILRATYGYLAPTWDTLKELPEPDPLKDGRMPEKLKAIRKLREYFQDKILIVGSCAAPFSAVGLTFGIDVSMTMMFTDPHFLHAVMDYWMGFYKKYIRAQRDAGAHAIWLGDCNAFSSMVPVSLYMEHIFPLTKKLIDFCEKELNIFIWMHNSETNIEHIKEQMHLGAGIMSIGPDGDIQKIRHLTKGKQPISGNLDPIKILLEGTPESISADVERIMKVCKSGGGFVFNTGEMNPRMVPEENMNAYMSAAKRLSDY